MLLLGAPSSPLRALLIQLKIQMLGPVGQAFIFAGTPSLHSNRGFEGLAQVFLTLAWGDTNMSTRMRYQDALEESKRRLKWLDSRQRHQKRRSRHHYQRQSRCRESFKAD